MNNVQKVVFQECHMTQNNAPIRKPIIPFLSSSCRRTQSLVQLHQRPLIRPYTAVTCIINLPTGLQFERANYMKSRKLKIADNRLAMRTRSLFLFFLSILRLPFHSLLFLFLPFSLRFLLSPFPLLFLGADWPKICRRTTKCWGVWHPPHHPARYGPAPEDSLLAILLPSNRGKVFIKKKSCAT